MANQQDAGEEEWEARPSITHEGQWEVYRRIKDLPEQQFLVRFHYMADELRDVLNALQQQVTALNALESENRVLRGLLAEHGEHDFTCDLRRMIPEPRQCSCGLAAALASPQPGGE